jgi:hypothetical protein
MVDALEHENAHRGAQAAHSALAWNGRLQPHGAIDLSQQLAYGYIALGSNDPKPFPERAFDLEEDWRLYGKEIFPILRGKYPQAYFAGIVALARIIKWEFGPVGAFDRPRTPEEIIDKLEERIGPKGRVLFEDFVRKINMLQAEQQLEQQQQQEQEQRGQQQRQQQRHTVSPPGAAGDDAVKEALAVAEKWRASDANQ